MISSRKTGQVAFDGSVTLLSSAWKRPRVKNYAKIQRFWKNFWRFGNFLSVFWLSASIKKRPNIYLLTVLKKCDFANKRSKFKDFVGLLKKASRFIFYFFWPLEGSLFLDLTVKETFFSIRLLRLWNLMEIILHNW